jgi:hypothetical protein
VVPTGRTTATDKQVAVLLRALLQHSVVFAGSGSGKAVLLRRLIEECASTAPRRSWSTRTTTWPASIGGHLAGRLDARPSSSSTNRWTSSPRWVS